MSKLFHYSGTLEISTPGRGMYDVTGKAARWLSGTGARDGLVHVFICHTSASLAIQENADPDVCADLVDALSRLAPQDGPYRHTCEGPDDMPAHIKSALTSTSLCVPVRGGHLSLGTWQGLYVIEHRTRPHRRTLELDFTGTGG